MSAPLTFTQFVSGRAWCDDIGAQLRIEFDDTTTPTRGWVYVESCYIEATVQLGVTLLTLERDSWLGSLHRNELRLYGWYLYEATDWPDASDTEATRDFLTRLLNAYCDAYALPHESADELLLRVGGLDEQREWIAHFIDAWDRNEKRAQKPDPTEALGDAAHREGWTIGNDEPGNLEIQRLDEAGIFDSDDDARIYVKARAKLGDKNAIDALRIVAQNDFDE